MFNNIDKSSSIENISTYLHYLTHDGEFEIYSTNLDGISFLCKACKTLFLALVVKEIKAERVEHCIDTQSLCLGSRVEMSPTCLLGKKYYGNLRHA